MSNQQQQQRLVEHELVGKADTEPQCSGHGDENTKRDQLRRRHRTPLAFTRQPVNPDPGQPHREDPRDGEVGKGQDENQCV